MYKNTSPQKISNIHVDNLPRHRCLRHGSLVHQKTRQRHRSAHPADPASELSIPRRRRCVDDASHRHIRECIHKSCDQKQCPHHSTADTEYLGIEYHQKRAGKNKGKIVAKVTEHVADLIPPAKVSHFSILHCTNPPSSAPIGTYEESMPGLSVLYTFFWRYMRSSASASSSWLFAFPALPASRSRY